MSFWEGLFAGAVAKMIVDYREENKKSKQWNELFGQLQDLEDDMTSFLESVGVPDTLVLLNPDVIDKGSIGLAQERQRLNSIKSKIREFISQGGHPENIGYYEDISIYLNQLHQLISNNILDEQDNLIGLSAECFPIALYVTRSLQEAPNDPATFNKLYYYVLERESYIEKLLSNTHGHRFEQIMATKNYIQKLKDIFEPFA